jgi:hypothetical protein
MAEVNLKLQRCGFPAMIEKAIAKRVGHGGEGADVRSEADHC